MEFLYSWIRDAASALQDIHWKEEAEAAEALGFGCHSFDCQRLIEGDADGALDILPDGDGQTLVYRGWLLKEEDYQALEDAVESRGYRLHTNAHQYATLRSLPNYFEQIAPLTPPAVWTWDADIEEAWDLARSMGKGPWIIKDHVKSAKEAWLEACYIPQGATHAQFQKVCEALMERRGDDFEGGFVIRPFVPLKELGAHWTGMPIYEEYRLFDWRGKRILSEPYHEGLVGLETHFEAYDDLGARVDSPFFVADVAKLQNGDFTLIELNDGGCAGIPPECDPAALYEAIAEIEEGREDTEDEDW